MNTWTPCPDAIVQDLGPIAALVYGRIWRYCQNAGHTCYASMDTIAKSIGFSRTAVYEAIHGSKERDTHKETRGLVEAGYLTMDQSSGETNTYRLTDKFFLGAALTGDEQPTRLASGGTRLASGTHTPSDTKIQEREKKDQYVPPTSVGGPKTEAEGRAIRNAALRVEREARKAAASTATAIAASMGEEVREKARAYLSAYLNGISPNGHNKKADDAMVVKEGVHVLDLNSAEYTPEDFGAAASYFKAKWTMGTSVKSVRAHLAEWDAKGRPSEDRSSGPDIVWG